ncbi:MAG: glycosyltransferase [Pseudorhodoplanes sp.]|nr:glycosyltransferase [Pseudorhodoplanes sp.]
MNIEIIASFEHASGAPMAALRLAHGLSERGHKLNATFIYRLETIPRSDFPFTLLFEREKVGALDALAAVSTLRRAFRERHADAVISFLPLANVIGQVAAFAAGVPVRLVSPRVPVTTYSRGMQLADSLLARTGIYTCVVAPTGAVLRSCGHYPKRLRDTFSVVNNGLLDWTPSTLSRAEARRHFGIPPGAFALVSVGRLAEQKNHAFLLPVMERIGDAVLLIAGGGELESQLRGEIAARGLQERVRLLGSIERTEIAKLLAAGDIFVQPSLFEGQSNALLEALASGLPCFVSDQPEQRETLTRADGTIAGAVLPFDAAAWAQAANRLKSDPVAANLARDAARKRAADFSFATMIDGFERALAPGRKRAVEAV